MLDPSDATENDTDVTLSEAAQAVMDVLSECHGNLEAVRRRLAGDEIEVDMDASELPTPGEQALRAASQFARPGGKPGAVRNITCTAMGGGHVMSSLKNLFLFFLSGGRPLASYPLASA